MARRRLMDMSLHARVWRKIWTDGDHLIWTGFINKGVYPRISRTGNQDSGTIQVRRYLYEQKYGHCPKYLYSNCDRIACVAPDHHTETLPRKYYKNKLNRKLSSSQVKYIRKAYALSERYKTTLSKLGKRFGVSRQAVEMIVNGKVHGRTWQPATSFRK